MKKKVCVISAYGYIVRKINYGSLLQYYALSKELEELGCESYWLRYVPKDTSFFKKTIKNLYSIVFKPKVFFRKKRILKTFKMFIKDNLFVSNKTYKSIIQLKHKCPFADYYITGSDQVWGGTLEANYLTFVNGKKRISYAASFGKSKLSQMHFNTIQPWLLQFDSISVREESGVNICNSLGVDSTCVLDPTLLIEKDVYLSNSIDEQVVLAYFLNVNNAKDAKLEIVKTISELYSTQYKYIGGVSNLDSIIDEDHLLFISPIDFISYYKNAKYIITNSFHGTVFAIIFHKPFYVFLQEGQFSPQNERVLSLLKMLSLEDRIFNNVSNLNYKNDEINWLKVDKQLDIERNKSILFLKKSLEINEGNLYGHQTKVKE